MTENDPNEFTDREKFILSFYRAKDLSGSRRISLYDGLFAIGSLACLLLYATNGDTAFGFVAYGLVAGRWLYFVIEGRRWNQDFRSIFAKYDAKLRSLTDAQRRKDGGGDVA
jgi:hypothetical protein